MNPPTLTARFPVGALVLYRDWSLPTHARKGYQARKGTLQSIHTPTESQRPIATVATARRLDAVDTP